jgi:hypothetical protein
MVKTIYRVSISFDDSILDLDDINNYSTILIYINQIKKMPPNFLGGILVCNYLILLRNYYT